MIAEIIIVGIFVVSTILAAFLAIHNIKELSKSRFEIDLLTDHNTGLSLENARLTYRVDELTRDLETERTNSKMLERALLDTIVTSEPEEVQANASNEPPISSEPEEDLQVTASNELPLPEGHTNVISGMPYTTITNKKSEQWALQLAAYTGKYGIRCYFDGDHIYFLAAMGSAYGRKIGTAFRVTLKCGTVLYVMLGEFKDDGTNPNFFGHPAQNYDEEIATCILEFIYDPEKIDAKVRGENGSGTFTVFEEFGGLHDAGGDIVKIEYIGRRWEP